MKKHSSAVEIIKHSEPGYKYWFLLLLLVFPLISNAQINPLADQYIINNFQLNPAIAGTERYSPITISTRQQWVGFIKAPTTKSISFHTAIRAKNVRFTPRGFVNKGSRSFGNIGVGGGAFNYNYGAISHTGIHLDYAYHIFIGNGRMGFGLAPLIYQFKINKSGFTLPDGDVIDPLISGAASESILFFDANVGLHYYDEFNYFGLSIIQLFGSGVQFGNFSFISEDHMGENPDLARSVYTYYGRHLVLNRDITIEPSVYLKFNGSNGFRFDVNTMVHFMNIFSTGVMFQYQKGFGMLAGVQLDNLEALYMFELPISSDIPTNFSSHQIMLRFSLGKPID
jgi:type IX secretion system PorP/SprF family membrane protein